MTRVSVVVPTYRRPDLLRRCLAALRAQDLPPSDYEVIVADDAADAGTRELVEREGARGAVPVRYVPVEGRHGPAAARNAGWRAARGAVIAFTDDDTVPAADWLSHGLTAFVDGVVGAAGAIHVPAPPVPTDYERNAARLAEAEFATANCFYRRDVLAAVGGFDERFTTAWREDSDLYFTLLERGKRLVRAPDAVVVHPIRPAPWGVSLGQQRKARFNALLYRKHPRLYRERIQAAPPWRYYGIAGALLASVGLALGGRRRAALAAVGVWLLLTGQFCAVRLRHTSRAPGHVAEMLVTSALIPLLAVYWRLRGALSFRVPFL